MQLYLVYKNEDYIEVLSRYSIENVAIKGIEKHALEYIESQIGKRNLFNCIQYSKTINDINSDNNLKEGFYLIKDGATIKVCYKKRKITHERKQVVTYVPTKVTEVIPEEVEVVVVEKVLKKVPVPSSSYISYYMGYSDEVEKEIEEQVIKKFILYTEKETTVNKEEISYVYEKKKEYNSTIICEFGLLSIDVDDIYITNNNIPTSTTNTDEKIVADKKKIKEIQSNYMNELVSLLQNGSIVHTLKKVSRN